MKNELEIKISVIVPIYKVEKYLNQCVDSILNQTYRNLEVILVDDGSPDQCPGICEDYARMDSRVVVIHKENGGLSDARNWGIQKATGDYVMFVDSDDFWDDLDSLRKLVERVKLSKVDILSFAYYKHYEENGNKIPMLDGSAAMPLSLQTKQQQLAYLTEKSLYTASACTKMIRREALQKTTFEKGRVSEDIAWSAQLMCVGNSFDFLNISFYCYRQRLGSISQGISERNVHDLAYAVKACANAAERCETEIRTYVGRYAAYQFSTFIAVQSFVDSPPESDIQELKPYTSVLQYYANNRKVKVMYYGVKLVGFVNWCRFIRWTKPIWNTRRDKI